MNPAARPGARGCAASVHVRAAVCVAALAQPALSLPAGFTTYFSAACPSGWAVATHTQGRVLVSVVNASQAGLTVGQPLGNMEDRIHTHTYVGSVVMPSKHVAGADCCNDAGAAAGTYPITGVSNLATSGLSFSQMYLCSLLAADATLDVPFGTVAYFGGPNATAAACPALWSPYTAAAGRTLVPQAIPVGGDPIASADAPLANQEDRVHVHTVTAQIDVADVEFAGVDGCCNDSPTSSGAIPFSATMQAASAGVPYVQMLTCFSTASSFNTSLPSAALYFNPFLNCQNGWVPAESLAGRFLVSLPEGGAMNAQWGGAPMSANATAAEGTQHTFAGSVDLPSTGVGLDSGCCADGYGSAGTTWYAATSSTTEAGFPFLAIPMCQYASGEYGVKR